MNPKDISNTRIDRGAGIIRIIANEQFVPLDEFDWHDADRYGGWITLNEISIRLKQLGFVPPYYVWEDTPMEGTIYQYGNYHPEVWEKYGTTRGFA